MISSSEKIIIVGQGLAGTVLAFLLIERGCDVLIIDDGHVSSSSIIAAGMWNPVSFKKLNRSWISDLLLPDLHEVYIKMEAKLHENFFHPSELVRIFPDHRSANEWDERSMHPELSEFLSPDQDNETKRAFIQHFGHGVIHDSGWLDMPKMLAASRTYFLKKNLLIERSFVESDAENSTVIFCTGWNRSADKLFDWLNIIPNKGELLTIHAEDLEMKRMSNFGKFLIPLGDHRYRLGATYELFQENPLPSSGAKNELLETLRSVYSGRIDVLDHNAGYRPTVPDRKPLLGFHPENTKVGIFNGFGSKGVMLVPFFAKHFIDHILDGEPLMKDVDIKRYWKRH